MSKNYISYLLRLWKTDIHGKPDWRVMLEDPHTHEITGFDNLSEYIRYLQNLASDGLDNRDDQDQITENQ